MVVFLVHGCICRKRARRDSEDVEESTDSEDMAYDGESDSDAAEMPAAGTEDLTPAEKLRKKREKPITRCVSLLLGSVSMLTTTD